MRDTVTVHCGLYVTISCLLYTSGRPSCAGEGYDAASAAGSYKGPTDEAYLAEGEARIDTFLKHHPYLSGKKVPAERVTASGSGLDPDITPALSLIHILNRK